MGSSISKWNLGSTCSDFAVRQWNLVAPNSFQITDNAWKTEPVDLKLLMTDEPGGTVVDGRTPRTLGQLIQGSYIFSAKGSIPR